MLRVRIGQYISAFRNRLHLTFPHLLINPLRLHDPGCRMISGSEAILSLPLTLHAMFTASELSRILDCSMEQPFPASVVQNISIDSRQITDGTGVCFVALKGLRSDGHQFLTQVWEKGVRNFVVEQETDLPELPHSNVFPVTNTVHALQSIATAYRSKFALECIGITGSNGKTWVKEWLYQLLSPDHYIVKSPRSYNSQIGVPLSVLQIRNEHTLGIFEAGISVKNEMTRLADVIRPNIGILTHLGDAHQAGFADLEEKLREKLELFHTCETIFYCSDEAWIDTCIQSAFSDKRLLSWSSINTDADLLVHEVKTIAGNTQVSYHWQGSAHSYTLPFDDQASIRNSVTCCLLMLDMGYMPEVINTRMSGLQPIAMRLAIHHLQGNSVLINDAYSLDMGSLTIALESLKQHSTGMSRTVIISDIDRQHAGSYEAIAKLFARHEVNHVLAIGEDIRELGSLLPEQISFRAFTDMQSFTSETPWRSLMPGAFLLKGARNFHFEHLAEQMQGRYHSAILEIDLNVLLTNLQFFMSKLKSGTRVIAMVKAAAYGSGGAEVARFLAFHNVSMLAVAYMDEGIELRNGGVTIPILVMNPDPDRIAQLYGYNLEPEVYDMTLLRAISDYAVSHPKRECNVHVKVDTGMHRLGFRKGDATMLSAFLSEQPSLHVGSVFTHLAAAGDLTEREFTLQQIRDFDGFYQILSESLGYQPMRHVLNTSGVLHFPEYQYEGVRLGIGLYGAGLPEAGERLQPVHSLKARLSQVHEISAGESVGYDRAFMASEKMRIGTINIGYADGLRRCAGRQKYSVMIHGKPATILGKVCMDMAMVDLTHHAEARAGDEVLVFGPGHPVDALAQVCDTNAYEILTGISQRVAKVFLYS